MVIFEWLVNEAERRDVDIRDLRYHGNEITLLMKARSIDMCMLLVEVYEFDIRTTLEMQIPLSPLMFFITFGLMDPAEYELSVVQMSMKSIMVTRYLLYNIYLILGYIY